ncbi:DNA repair protein RAD16 [Coemansia thaxteri]|uniref:DNA repair protein RAD16 n=1 Tax=Coemansia thaxteri TaxID=2663907 RepID=A0A9W8BBE6_9FUNG|nr:DNA repair protein RAD16 [Coemansia thaxteri]
MTLLPFQRLILDSLLDEDALCVVARGLGLGRVLAELARACATPQALVFLLNASDADEAALQEQLLALPSGGADACVLRLVRAETNAGARAHVYRQGGLVAATTRILTVDLLNGVVPAELITGVVVLNASRVSAESMEAFALRLVRLRSPHAFVKALSDAPEAFTLGFAPLERTLKALGLRHVRLWPRFHVAVQAGLAAARAPVAELRVAPTRAMVDLQQAALDCVAALIAELQQATKLLDPELVSVEASLFRHFDAQVKRLLAPHWHRLGPRVRAMAADLAALRRVAELVTACDAVALLRHLDALLAATKASAGPPPWLSLDSANILYSVARARVFASSEPCPELAALGLPAAIAPVLEVPPKLPLLARILDEVGAARPAGPVLVMAASLRECRMIRDFLASARHPPVVLRGTAHPRVMVDMLRAFFRWKARVSAASRAPPRPAQPAQPAQPLARGPPPTKRRRVRGASAAGARLPRAPADSLEQETAELATQTPAPPDEPSASASESDSDCASELDFDEHFGILPSSETVLVLPYSALDNKDLLPAVQPTHIVMYDPDPAFIRQIELYQARGFALNQVYFMVYDNSIEEQRYLSAIRREREAFETLIRQNASLVIPITSLASPVSALALARRSQRSALQTSVDPLVVVDVREFRSPLPSLLHAAGFTVVPRTINIGDYVLHDHLCVERKSLPDLVQSLKSGRLFNQAEAMTTHYTYAVLLIEFELNTSFSLQPIGALSPNIAFNSLTSQLTLLVLAFPRLRIIWSSSPYESVAIFSDLKRDSAEPDIDRAVSMGQSDDSVEKESIYAAGPIALLMSLPGVSLRNYQSLARKFSSVREICSAPIEDLAAVLGQESATKLFDFVHAKQ